MADGAGLRFARQRALLGLVGRDHPIFQMIRASVPPRTRHLDVCESLIALERAGICQHLRRQVRPVIWQPDPAGDFADSLQRMIPSVTFAHEFAPPPGGGPEAGPDVALVFEGSLEESSSGAELGAHVVQTGAPFFYLRSHIASDLDDLEQELNGHYRLYPVPLFPVPMEPGGQPRARKKNDLLECDDRFEAFVRFRHIMGWRKPGP